MADVAVRDEAVSLIDGKPLTTRGRRIPVTNAYTLKTLGEVVEVVEAVVDRAVGAARAAFGEWSARSASRSSRT